jgi:predicted phage tail component-like protein
MKSIDRTMLPSMRRREIVIPNKHGTYDFYGGTFEKRLLDVELKYVGSSLTALRTNARSIAAWLETLSAVKTLKFDDETDKYYNARIFSNIGLSNLFLLGETTVQFECEPFAYAALDEYDETYNYDEGHEYDSGLYYANATSAGASFNWSFRPHYAGLYNHATYKTPLSITITGDVENPIITNETSGISSTLTISAAVTSSGSDTLIIDSENYTVELNGTNILSGVSGDFIELAVGENGLNFNAEYGGVTAEVTFSFLHRWI